MEIRGGQEFEVEAGATDESGGERPGEVDAQHDAVVAGLGADHEIEIGITQVRLDALAGGVHAALDELRHGIPLAGRGAEADVAVGDGADAMVDQFDAGDLRVAEETVVDVAEDEDVHAAGFEIAAIVQRQRGGSGGRRAGDEEGEGGG